MVEEKKEYELSDLELELFGPDFGGKYQKVPKMRIYIEEISWGSKGAVEILRESMAEDKNWEKIQYWCNKLDKETEIQFEALVESFNRLKDLKFLGDVLMGADASEPDGAEEFNTFVRNLEEHEEHAFFKHVHDIEFIDLTTDIKELAKQEGILPKD